MCAHAPHSPSKSVIRCIFPLVSIATVMTIVWLSCTWSGNIHLIRNKTATSVPIKQKKHTLSISWTEMQNMWSSVGRFSVVVPVLCLNVRSSAPDD